MLAVGLMAERIFGKLPAQRLPDSVSCLQADAGVSVAPMGSNRAGLWDLTSVEQLLPKLKDDLKRMEAEPENPFPAYDFFVTAYHMYEWAGKGDGSIKKRLEREPLVRVAGEIATRAKHFYAADAKWVYLAGMEDRVPGPLGPTPAVLPTALRVIIHDPLPPQIHEHEVSAVVLARLLVERWARWVSEGK